MTRGTVTSTMRRVAHPSGCATCGAGAGCLAIKYQSPLGLATCEWPRSCPPWPVDLIRMSIQYRYSGSTKITSHLDHIRRSKTTSGTNKCSYLVFIINGGAHLRMASCSLMPRQSFDYSTTVEGVGPCPVANRATLPQKCPPLSRNVADSRELTATTQQAEPSISRGRMVHAEGCNGGRATCGWHPARSWPPWPHAGTTFSVRMNLCSSLLLLTQDFSTNRTSIYV